ncbi:MAG: putative Histidine kinase [Thermoleophilia bacterium]|nr:putative Histidine kinase [Thermoleophilia bacterium]
MPDDDESSRELEAATDAARLAEEVANVRVASADAQIDDARARIVDADAQTQHARTGMAAASAHMKAAQAHMQDASVREEHAQDLTDKADLEMTRAAALIANLREDSAEYDRAVHHYTQLVRHRMANPLQSICGMAQALQEQPDMSQERRVEMVDHILEQARVLERVSLAPRQQHTTERDLHPRPFDIAATQPPPNADSIDASGFLPDIPRHVAPPLDVDRDWMATRAAMEETIALTAEVVLQPSLYEAAQLLARALPSIVGAEEVAFAGAGPYRDILVGNPPYEASGAATGDPAGWHCVTIQNPFSTDADAAHGTLWTPRCADVAEDVLVLTQLQAAARHLAAPLGALAERKHLRAQLRTEHALVGAGKALAEERTLEGVLQRIVELACELVDARYGALGVLDESGQALANFITVGADAATRAAIGDLPTGQGILGVLINDAQPLRLATLGDDPRSVGFPANHPPMTSFLGVPIISRGEVKGRIYLTEKRGASSFSAEDERVVVTLASQAAIAMQSAELYEGTSDVARDLAGANVTLEQADRHRSAFLTNMSHELRTPLNSILGYTTLLIDDSTNLDAQQLEDLGVIRSSGTHLLGLIGDLLDLSRIEAGALELRLAAVDVVDLVRDTVASLKPQVDASGVEVVIDAPASASITCDRSRVKQILLNVLANAVKFTTEGSIFVTVTVTSEEGVSCQVHDTGPGIPPADVERIFEPFFQSGQALVRRPRQNEGAGLGLSISRMLATAHGGDMTLTSRLGEGTTVTIDLPKLPRPAADVPHDT